MNPTTTIEVITPKIAEEMLEGNEGNRKVNHPNLDYLCHEMKKANFRLTGDTIKISKSGRLLDGQHRLMAVVKTKVTIRCNVTRGLEEDIFKFIDLNKTRGAHDVLQIEGISNAAKMAVMIKFIISYKNGRIHHAVNHKSTKATKITNYDVSEFYRKHSDSLEYSLSVGWNNKNKIIPGSIMAGLHYCLKDINFDDATAFIKSTIDGINLGKTSPIFVLREKLIANMSNTLKMPAAMRLAIIIKAWNAFRKGRVISKLYYDGTKEDFPKAI